MTETTTRPHGRRATQVDHPWRATIRTVLWAVVSFAGVAPLIYAAAAKQDPTLATGWVAVALAVLAAVQRVMTLPAVDSFLQEYAPWLAARPPLAPAPEPEPDEPDEPVETASLEL